MTVIKALVAREIFDSRGNPTVEVDVLAGGALFRAAVPSGASTGIYEALELRDGDKKRLMGKGVLKAVSNINTVLAPKLVGLSCQDQASIDRLMVETIDGSKNKYGWSKSKLGANAVLAVSIAVCRAGAAAHDLELYEYIAKLSGRPTNKFVMPVPSFNVINGGSHAGNRLACQEFMILPVGAATFREAMIIGAEVYHTLKGVIKKKYGQDACNVGDEGGFAPSVQDNNEALDILMEAIEKSGHASKVKIGTDVAASEFYESGSKTYDLDFKNPKGSAPEMKKSAAEMVAYYKQWLAKYPLVSIEDPFDQDDWDAWSLIMKEVGSTTQIVGDDFLVTNPTRVQSALATQGCNALLLKVNQIGSVTEAIEAATMAQGAGWGVMVSHRSGETEDTFIADLAVGLCAGQIKTGAPCRSERLAKYNQLLRIEEDLGPLAAFAGQHFRQPHLAAGLPAPKSVQKQVVVVGGECQAFVEALLKKGGGRFEVSLLCEERFLACDRAQLAALCAHKTPEKVSVSAEAWCKEKGVSLVAGRAVKVDRNKRTVDYALSSGGTGSLSYDELVFATGSRPFIPPLPRGLDPSVKGIFAFQSIEGCLALAEHAKGAKKAAVVGSGCQALEAVKALLGLGLGEVSLVEPGPTLLGAQLDEEAAGLLKAKLEASGKVKVLAGAKTREVLKAKGGAVTGLRLAIRGEERVLDVDLVVLEAGVVPRHRLAKDCGLALGARGGLKVDSRLRSVTDDHVHAVGEVAAVNGGICHGLAAALAQQAGVLAEQLANPSTKEGFDGSDLSMKMEVMGTELASLGAAPSFWFARQFAEEDVHKVLSLVLRDPTKGSYKKLVFNPEGNRLLGGLLLGEAAAEYAKLSALCGRGDLGGLTPEDVLAGK